MSERRGGGKWGAPVKGQVLDRKPVNKKATLVRLLRYMMHFRWLLLLALAALGGGWYLTGGDLAALPERLKALRLPEWITLWQAHEPKPGARLI